MVPADTHADLTHGLGRYLAAFRGLGPPPLASRLSDFLSRARALRQPDDQPTSSPPPPRAPLDQTRLRQTLTALGPALGRRRRLAPDLNVWTVSGIGFDEVRVSSVLAWFLNPAGSHGEGSRFADAVWQAAGGDHLGFDLQGLRRSATEVCPLADLADRVDVVLDGDEFSVFIEVKVYAGLQPAQLERYLTAVELSARLRDKTHAALIYLAPFPTKLPPGPCLSLNWRKLATAFRTAARDCHTPLVQQSALHFAQHIETF